MSRPNLVALAKSLADKTGLTTEESKIILAAFSEVLAEHFEAGRELRIPDIGILRWKPTRALSEAEKLQARGRTRKKLHFSSVQAYRRKWFSDGKVRSSDRQEPDKTGNDNEG